MYNSTKSETTGEGGITSSFLSIEWSDETVARTAEEDGRQARTHSLALWPGLQHRRQTRPERGQAWARWPDSWQTEHWGGQREYHTRQSKPSIWTKPGPTEPISSFVDHPSYFTRVKQLSSFFFFFFRGNGLQDRWLFFGCLASYSFIGKRNNVRAQRSWNDSHKSGILKFELSDLEMVFFFQSFKRGSVGGIVAGQLTGLSILS